MFFIIVLNYFVCNFSDKHDRLRRICRTLIIVRGEANFWNKFLTVVSNTITEICVLLKGCATLNDIMKLHKKNLCDQKCIYAKCWQAELKRSKILFYHI